MNKNQSKGNYANAHSPEALEKRRKTMEATMAKRRAEKEKKAQMNRFEQISSYMERLSELRDKIKRTDRTHLVGNDYLLVVYKDEIELSFKESSIVSRCLVEHWENEIAEIESELGKYEIIVNK